MVRIFVPVASRFIRPRTNTDWRYAAKLLPLLSTYCPDLSIATQRNSFADVKVNFRYSLAIARSFPILKRMPTRWTYSLGEDNPVSESDIRSDNFQAVLAYERYPSNSYGLPVAWITSPTDVERQQLEGATAADAYRLKEWKWTRAERASRLIFTTQTYLDEFVHQSNESLRAKSVVIPFFLPGLRAASDITDKWHDDKLHFLFVGRQARRKGLPAALNALTPLLKDDPRLSLTIVSNMVDGPVTIPHLPNIHVLPEATRDEVLALMRQAHVLLMPSSWESYGFVYVEAMSQGCVPLAVDRPVQRELFGGYGILVDSQEPEAIRAGICESIKNRDILFKKAQGGLNDFRYKHSPDAVANAFLQTFLSMTTAKAAAERT